MDAIAQAKKYMAAYEAYLDRRRGNPDCMMPTGSELREIAMQYAAIAQAEQLRRIADALYTQPVSGQQGDSIADALTTIAMSKY